MVTLEGKQLEGDFSTEAARDLIAKNAGKPALVWKPGMAQWAEASTIPELRPPAAPGSAPSAAQAAHAPGPSAKLAASIDKEELKQQVGVMRGLLDFRFQSFITTRMIPVVYAVAMILIALGALIYFFFVGGGSLISGIRFKSGALIFTGLLSMVLAPIVAILYVILIRMWFEMAIVFFRMKENLDELVKNTSSSKKT
jgi:hypothetical protein